MRECGPCTECCFAIGVAELDKPMWRACAHERRGCGIYAKRPTSCRTFRCLWLGGDLERKDRPDRLGIVMATAHTALGHTVVVAYVRKLDADKGGRGAELLLKLAEHIPVCVIRRNGSRRVLSADHERLPEIIREFNRHLPIAPAR